MADGTRRTSRPNVTKSYKNSCGAPAPRGFIQPASGTSSKSVTVKKKLRITGGNLAYTRLGEALSPGSVSYICQNPIISSSHISQWCSNCRNGGTLVICDDCRLTSLCTGCIDINIDDENLEFQCPPCFLKKNNQGIYVCRYSIILSTDTLHVQT
jgi:hypothetical protein